MTAWLTAAAVFATIVLLLSATHTTSSATASDPYTRGPWGVVTWSSTRNQALDPHERRWQTTLLLGKDNRSRWRDLVDEIKALERMSDATVIGTAPQSYDASWIEAMLTNLETNQVKPPQDTTP